MKEFRPVGNPGDDRALCIVCVRGTDTGFAILGDARFATVALSTFIPDDRPTSFAGEALSPFDRASALIDIQLGRERGRRSVTRQNWIFRVCEDCARCARGGGAKVGLISNEVGLPTYAQYHYE